MRLEERMERSEELLETNEQNKRQVINARQQVQHAGNRANAALAQTQRCQAQLQQAVAARNAAQQQASKEEGGSVSPAYDEAISRARAELQAANRELQESKRELTEAKENLSAAEGALGESSRALHGVVDELQQISEHYGIQMGKTMELMSLPQGQLAGPLLEKLGIGRGKLDDLRRRIAASLGIAVAASSIPGGFAGGSGHGVRARILSRSGSNTLRRGGGFGSTGGDDSSGGGKANIFTRLGANQNSAPISRKYKSVEEMPEEVWKAANDYQTNHMEKYNAPIRQGTTSDDIENLKGIIREHRIAEDTVFYRRATLEDMKEALPNCPLDELAGKRYQFQGIMSTAGSKAMADAVSAGDVLFEIHAPAGTPALDLTDVASFQEAMFYSPLCYIEKVEPEGYNTTRIVVKVFSSNEYHDIVDALKENGVEHNPIQLFGRDRTSEEIVSRISGGDKTEGSCSSLALAFSGNEAGYDVLDFRDGSSREFFSSRETVAKIAGLPSVISATEYGRDDIACVSKLLQNVSPGKNYYLATGGHAAIIRNNGSQFEYLEMQHSGYWNGWHSLNERELITRFGCSQNRLFKTSSFIMDVQSLSNSQEFLDILGYINTRDQAQRKGSSGNVK